MTSGGGALHTPRQLRSSILAPSARISTTPSTLWVKMNVAKSSLGVQVA